MGLPAYRNGIPLGWKWRDFLENWTQGFEIPLDELRDFLRSHSYPLPVEFFPDEQEDFDCISPLMACWFHIDDISNFQPTDRYITGKAPSRALG